MAQRQGYGLDPAAQQITGAANTVMQGLSNWQQMQAQEEDREWTREQRERQREEWEVDDQVYDILAKSLRQGKGKQGQAQGQAQDQDQKAQDQAGGPIMGTAAFDQEPQAALQEVSAGREAAQSAQTQGLTPAAFAGPQQSGGADQQQQQPSELESKMQVTPGYTKPGGMFKDMDLSDYDPRAILKARDKAIEMQINNMRYSREGMRHMREKAQMNMQQGQEKMQRAIMAYKQGDQDTAVSLAQEAYNQHLPNGQVAGFSPEGKVRARNFVTGAEGELDVDLNDPEQVGQILEEMAAYFSNPDQYLRDYAVNSETQLQYKIEAMKNAQAYRNKAGEVVYRVDMPNSDSTDVDTMFFDHMPTFDLSDPLSGEEAEKVQDNYLPVEQAERVWGKDKAKIKDYHFDHDQDGNPVTLGYTTKSGQYVPYSEPISGWMGETPESPSKGAKQEQELLDDRIKTARNDVKDNIDELARDVDSSQTKDLLQGLAAQARGNQSIKDSDSQEVRSAYQMLQEMADDPEADEITRERAERTLEMINIRDRLVQRKLGQGQESPQPAPDYGIYLDRPQLGGGEQKPSNRLGLRLPTRPMTPTPQQARSGEPRSSGGGTDWRDYR